MARQIFAYIIQKDGKIDDTAFELVSAAKKLDPEAPVVALVAGAGEALASACGQAARIRRFFWIAQAGATGIGRPPPMGPTYRTVRSPYLTVSPIGASSFEIRAVTLSMACSTAAVPLKFSASAGAFAPRSDARAIAGSKRRMRTRMSVLIVRPYLLYGLTSDFAI